MKATKEVISRTPIQKSGTAHRSRSVGRFGPRTLLWGARTTASRCGRLTAPSRPEGSIVSLSATIAA